MGERLGRAAGGQKMNYFSKSSVSLNDVNRKESGFTPHSPLHPGPHRHKRQFTQLTIVATVLSKAEWGAHGGRGYNEGNGGGSNLDLQGLTCLPSNGRLQFLFPCIWVTLELSLVTQFIISKM